MPVPSMPAMRAEPWAASVVERNLPALPGARLHAHRLQRDGQQAGGHLFARGDHGVIFALVIERIGLLAPADQFVGLAGHGRDDDGNIIAGIDLAFDVARDILDALDVGDRGAAEFHHEAGHELSFRGLDLNFRATMRSDWMPKPCDARYKAQNRV
jgi:hypothetical protein